MHKREFIYIFMIIFITHYRKKM